MTEYFCAKYTPSGFVTVLESFFLNMALYDVIKGRILPE